MHIREIKDLRTIVGTHVAAGMIEGIAVYSDGYEGKFQLRLREDGQKPEVRQFKRDTRGGWRAHDGWTPNANPSIPRAELIREFFADTSAALVEAAWRDYNAEEEETDRRNALRRAYLDKRDAGPALFAALGSLVAAIEAGHSRDVDAAIDAAERALALAENGAPRRFRTRPIGSEHWGFDRAAADEQDARERAAFTGGYDLKDANGRSRSHLPEDIEVEEVRS